MSPFKALPALLIMPFVLSGCSSEKADPESPADPASTVGSTKPVDDSSNPYEDLRERALSAAGMNLPKDPGAPDVVSVVTDIPAQGGYATLVAMSDGATSLYTSTGGGTIGAGEHQPVREATRALLSEAQHGFGGLPVTNETDHPETGQVRIFVVTHDDTRVANVPEREFWRSGEGQHSELVAAIQNVMTQVRQVR